jgi:hypothetical protein
VLDEVRLITPLRELNKVPGAVEIGPLKRGLLRRQAGIPQGRHQGGLQDLCPAGPQGSLVSEKRFFSFCSLY